MVFVTNKLVKSKHRLICSIRSILQPCTATSDIFSLSRLAEPPLTCTIHPASRASKTSSLNPLPRVQAERTVAKTVPKLTLFGPAPTRQLRRRPETGEGAMACANSLLPQRRRATRDPVLTTQHVGDHRACTRRIDITYLAD